MILNILIIVVLLSSFWAGWRRGLFLELMKVLSLGISFIVASLLYQEYAGKLISAFKLSVPTEGLKLLNNAIVAKATEPFFAAITWSLIFIGTRILLKLLMLSLRRFRKLLSFGKLGRLAAGLLSLALTYFSIQIFLTILSLYPLASLQNFLAGSQVASWMVLHTPVTSGALLKLFVERLIHLSPY